MRTLGSHYGQRSPGRGNRHADSFEHAVLRTRKAAGDEHQLRRHLVLGARDVLGLSRRPIQIDHAQARSRTLLVQQHLERIHAPGTHLATHRSDSLLLAVVGLLNVGPLRPGVARRALIGRGRQKLKLAHTARTLAHGGTHAVVAGIAAANDHDVQAASVHRELATIEQRDGRSRQVVHGIHHAGRFDVRSRKPARGTGTSSHHDSVKAIELGCHRRVRHIGAQLKHNAQLTHERHATLDHGLLELHVGNAIHKQTARAVIALKHRHTGAATRKLPCSHQPSRSRTNHRDRGRILPRRLKAARTAVGPLMVANRALVIVNRRGLAVDRTQVARGLAQRRTHAARKLGHGRGERQALGRLVPAAAVHQLVPLGNQVMQRAAARACLAKARAHLAKRHTAHHAAARLGATRIVVELHVQRIKIMAALLHGAKLVGHAIDIKKSTGLTHGTYASFLVEATELAATDAAPAASPAASKRATSAALARPVTMSNASSSA